MCAAIERVLDQNSLNMEIIVNNKSLDNGLNVIQLETAVGAAMKSFEGGLGECSTYLSDIHHLHCFVLGVVIPFLVGTSNYLDLCVEIN